MRCGACDREIRAGEASEQRMWPTNSGPCQPGRAHVICPPEDEE